MKHTQQLKNWINDTVQYYLYKMRSKHWIRRDVVNVILDQDYMEQLEEGWDEWAEENGFEPHKPIPYDIQDNGHVVFGAMLSRFESEDQEYFLLMWLNLKFFVNLAELQKTIVHELVHLNYPSIEHGAVFDKIVDIYVEGGFSGLWRLHNYFLNSERKKQRKITDYFI
jgi:hypothetical protein